MSGIWAPSWRFRMCFFGKGICGGRLFSKVSLRRQVGRQILPKNLPKIFQKSSKMDPKWRQNGQKIDPKRHPKNDRSQEQPQGAPYPVRAGHLGASWGRLGASWAGKVANMVPTWPQVGSQVGAKMDKKTHPKIDQKIDASWDRFLEGFWWNLGGKMEPSWHQNGIKNRC